MKKILLLILPVFLLTNSYAFPSGKYECDFGLFTITYILKDNGRAKSIVKNEVKETTAQRGNWLDDDDAAIIFDYDTVLEKKGNKYLIGGELECKKILKNHVSRNENTDSKNSILTNLQNHIKRHNKKAISVMVEYPLRRFSTIPSIQTKEEFIIKYDYIFDDKLKSLILNSTNKDLVNMGYRGTMLKDGLIWFRDGKIIAINHKSNKEKNFIKQIKKLDNQSIHPSIRSFHKNKLVFITKKFKIRIDELNDLTFRYVSWQKDESQKMKPSLILKNGTMNFDGSGGNYHYTFNNGQYKYVIRRNILGYDDSIGTLEVYKKDKLLVSHKILTLL